jgi:hypothetical protein
MIDHLKDIVQHTYGLGVITMLKVTGDANSTAINAFDQATKTVVLNAEFKAPIAEFVGVFGMPNLDRLNTILNIPEYKEGAKISVTSQKDPEGTDVPASVSFENKTGDFNFLQTCSLQAMHKFNFDGCRHSLFFILQTISGANINQFNAGRNRHRSTLKEF